MSVDSQTSVPFDVISKAVGPVSTAIGWFPVSVSVNVNWAGSSKSYVGLSVVTVVVNKLSRRGHDLNGRGLTARVELVGDGKCARRVARRQLVGNAVPRRRLREGLARLERHPAIALGSPLVRKVSGNNEFQTSLPFCLTSKLEGPSRTWTGVVPTLVSVNVN